MWLIALISILNACLHNKLVNSPAMRIEIAHLPLNIFDFGLVIAFIWSFMPAGSTRFHTQSVHPGFIWAIVLFGLALVLGSFGGMANAEATSRMVITSSRNFAMVLVAIVAGYRATKNLSSGLVYCYVVILCGVIVSCIIPLDFANASEGLHQEQSILNVRIIQYVANYGGLAGGLLVFGLGFKGKPLLPRKLGILIAGFCCVGQCATLSRSDWAAVVASLVVALAVMPLYSLRRKIMTALIAAPVLIGFAVGGIFLAEKVSGREMFSKISTRIISMLPGEHEGVKSAAATRLTGTMKELEYWAHSPVWGQGFAIQDSAALDEWQAAAAGFRHNTWSSTLAETGLIGFSAMALMCFGQLIIGWKMVRRRLDRRTVFVGAAGAITGAHFIIHGLCTMSFNTLRPAIPVAIMFGVVLRTRAIEKTMLAMYEGYLPDATASEYEAVPLLDGGEIPAMTPIPASQWAGQGYQVGARF